MDALAANATRFLADAEALAAQIPDGAQIAMPPDYSLPAMAVVRALVRRKARGLRLLGVPVLGMCADLLIGAGCVAEVETSAVSLGEAGLAPRFGEAAEKGEIVVRDATCPMVHSGLQAAEKGVPFMPLRGVLGSVLVGLRPDWKVIDNPMQNRGQTTFSEKTWSDPDFSDYSDPIILAPAISPAVAPALSGSFRPLPVSPQTTRSSPRVAFARARLRRPATDAALAGSQNTPSHRARSRYDARISASLTASIAASRGLRSPSW